MTLDKKDWLAICGLLMLKDTAYHYNLFRIIFLQIQERRGMIYISLDRSALLVLSNLIARKGIRCDSS
jgi:hypothetical protein